MFGCAPGVVRTRVGYSGGTKRCPSYYDLGDHTETTDIEFDPQQTSYEALLGMFWRNHDCTARCSRQYMSAIFYHDEEQKALAERTMKEQASRQTKNITTKILPAGEFTEAEDYHQKYLLQKHGALLSSLDIEPGDDLIKSHVAARLNGYVGGYGKLQDFDAEWERLGLNNQMAEYVRNIIRTQRR
ncbi:Peptide methionine sulfoxide reductase [Amphibalanus amphitrite]|uniref:peptide-methionine (S)-S-oxide reductase n=1 Tax=Amphibalanus amphitrite TaxID=1232801 RepID=A0A6A4VJ70_AMPAM|nr:Peptide methionine sulfoxide reductase [Amphibalanus amphitrite]